MLSVARTIATSPPTFFTCSGTTWPCSSAGLSSAMPSSEPRSPEIEARGHRALDPADFQFAGDRDDRRVRFGRLHRDVAARGLDLEPPRYGTEPDVAGGRACGDLAEAADDAELGRAVGELEVGSGGTRDANLDIAAPGDSDRAPADAVLLLDRDHVAARPLVGPDHHILDGVHSGAGSGGRRSRGSRRRASAFPTRRRRRGCGEFGYPSGVSACGARGHRGRRASGRRSVMRALCTPPRELPGPCPRPP